MPKSLSPDTSSAKPKSRPLNMKSNVSQPSKTDSDVPQPSKTDSNAPQPSKTESNVPQPLKMESNVVGQPKEIAEEPPPQQKLPKMGEFIDLDLETSNNNGFVMIGASEEIYRIKVHRYKEVKHYIKGEVLGRGKFGVVREFIDKRTLKRFAGKIIRRHILRKNPHLCNQINKELSITYHFDHRNIMRVYDLYATSTKIYLFMEFCYGELTEFLDVYHHLPKCQAKDYFSQIIEGLNYLHSHGIIHRDIKPENILITPDNVLKLADFGVCQEVSYFSDNDLVWGTDGTPLYHPPELFDMKMLKYSGSKIDIWASGVVLFRMVTGTLPFFYRADTTQEDIDEILTKNVNYPDIIRSDVLLIDLFNGIFEKDFKKRIDILSIRNHPWMQMDRNRNEQYREFPMDTNRQGVDRFRGLTVLTRIFNRYYPPPTEDRLVNLREFEESCKALPLTRPSRQSHEERIKLIRKDHCKLNFI